MRAVDKYEKTIPLGIKYDISEIHFSVLPVISCVASVIIVAEI